MDGNGYWNNDITDAMVLVVGLNSKVVSGYGNDPKQIGVVSATFLIFNRIIGTGIFATPSAILLLTGSVGTSLLVWVIGMLIAMAGTAVYLEFGTAIPRYLYVYMIAHQDGALD